MSRLAPRYTGAIGLANPSCTGQCSNRLSPPRSSKPRDSPVPAVSVEAVSPVRRSLTAEPGQPRETSASAVRDLRTGETASTETAGTGESRGLDERGGESLLEHWPVQLGLANPMAPVYRGHRVGQSQLHGPMLQQALSPALIQASRLAGSRRLRGGGLPSAQISHSGTTGLSGLPGFRCER